MGSFIPGVAHKDHWHQCFGLWTNGYLEIQFQYMKKYPPFDKEEPRLAYLEKLNNIVGINFSEDVIDRRPSIKLRLFTDKKNLEQLIEVLDWFVKEVKSV